MTRPLLSTIEQRTRLAGHNRLALLLFRLGGEPLFGINVFKVHEVVQRPPVRRMPGSHPLVLGVADIRRRTIPVLDLAAAIRQPASSAAGYLVVSEFNRSVQGFLVEAVDRIINVSVEDVKPSPRVATGDSFLTAVTRYGERLVQIIDVERVLSEVAGQPGSVDAELVAGFDRAQAVGRRVLVVDDSAVAREQIRRVLEQVGVECTALNDGREALSHLQAIADRGEDVSQRYAMLISDIEMPDMDGYTLASRVRQDPRLAGLYLLLHTSLSGVFNRSMVETVGADRFVAKYSPDDLARAVIERLEGLAAAA